MIRIPKKYRWSQVSTKRKRSIYIGATGLSIVGVFHYKFNQCIEVVGNPAGVTRPSTLFWLRVLFGRMRSRWMGSLMETHVPVALREPLYSAYASRYGIDLSEVRYPLDSYGCFQDFFSRSLRDGVRPVADVPQGLVSPVDATVLTIGEINGSNARVEQVKGATYDVTAFLGRDPTESITEGTSLQYVVLYLGPGDYHRFHAPAKVEVRGGRHFCGDLLPVRSSMLRRMPDVLAVNERVIVICNWAFGNLYLGAVAAANVGNIWLDFDQKLKTNRMRDIAVYLGGDISSKVYRESDRPSLGAGDLMGGFKLGSTVVMVLETPAGFKWSVSPGDKVQVGRPLGQVE